jgi:hypothetical protein
MLAAHRAGRDGVDLDVLRAHSAAKVRVRPACPAGRGARKA